MKKIIKLRENNQGIAAIEFAIILPILLFLLYGVIEFTRYVYFHQKLETTTGRSINILNQSLNPSNNSIDVIFEATKKMMEPFDSGNMVMIITAIQQDNSSGPANIKWQVTRGVQRKDEIIKSDFPAPPDGKTSIDGLNLRKRDQVIALELFHAYEPILDLKIIESAGITKEPIHKLSLARPRYGSFQFPPK